MPCRSLRAVLLALCLLLALPTTALAATEARSSSRAEQALVDLINDRRAEAGLPALTARADLHRIARDWSFRQAERGHMDHNPNLGSQACCWTRIAENVGRSGGHDGDGATAVARALMQLWRNSSTHDATMTDRGVDQIGVGVVIDDDGNAWGTVDFRKCDGSDCAGGPQGPAGDSSVSWAPPPAPEPEPVDEDPPAAPSPEPSPSPAPSPSPSPAPSPSPSPSPSPAPSPAPAASASPSPAPAPPLDAAAATAESGTAGPGAWSLVGVIGGLLALTVSVAGWRRRGRRRM